MSLKTIPPARSGEILPQDDPLGPPPNRPMTDDERRGFNWALGAMMLWGAQLERNGRLTGGASTAIPMREVMAHGGRMVKGCAEALHLTLGRAA